MFKLFQAELIYSGLCVKQLKNSHENKPEKIEQILFLMQYHTLHTREKRLYMYKTYIDDDNIHIPYISYLLRVMPLTRISPKERYISSYDLQNVKNSKKE